MNHETVSALGTLENGSCPAPLARPARSRVWKSVVFVWKYLMGVVFCQSLPGSILVVGWTYRLAQRSVLKRWWQGSAAAKNGTSFQTFSAASLHTQSHGHWPNWFCQHNAARILGQLKEPVRWALLKSAMKAALLSLGMNLRTGAQGIFNTWVLTLPAGVLWLFAWYDGWNNSFNKGYEQAAVGPLTGVFGVLLFIAAMFYLPMAQIRQASTGEWRSFYQFKLVWGLIRRRWLACLGLAALYAALSLPILILKIIPGFLPQMNPALQNSTDARALEILKAYFFWSGFVVFPFYVVLRLAAARIYAAAVLSAVQCGAMTEEMLAENEWEALHRLDLLQIKPEQPRHFLVRFLAWIGTRAGRATVAVATFLVWFTLAAQIFAAEFFLKTDHGRGWLNQPLVQLPWFNNIPARLTGGGNH